MATRPRQVRIQLTGGISDLEAWKRDLDEVADDQGFIQTFENGPKRFGDHGPLHKLIIGYTTKP